MVEPFRLPADDEHAAVVGRNGSGKTMLGAFLLSMQDLRRKTWLVLDYKGEEIFHSLANARPSSTRRANHPASQATHPAPRAAASESSSGRRSAPCSRMCRSPVRR